MLEFHKENYVQTIYPNRTKIMHIVNQPAKWLTRWRRSGCNARNGKQKIGMSIKLDLQYGATLAYKPLQPNEQHK